MQALRYDSVVSADTGSWEPSCMPLAGDDEDARAVMYELNVKEVSRRRIDTRSMSA
jgi:hypothetical protein